MNESPKESYMEYRQLGSSDLRISTIGFGSMSMKGTNEEDGALIDKAIDYGINYFDTADIYNNGLNEISVGKALKSKRDKVIIGSKVGNQIKEHGNGFNWNASKNYILSAVEASLKRLNTDYLDLYQLHGGTIEDPVEETIEAFELLKKQGKIRYYGISSIRPNVIERFVRLSDIVSVMIQYSLLDRRAEEFCLPLLQKNNIGVLARGCVAGGLLVDKQPGAYLKYTEQEVLRAANAIKQSSTNRSPSQTAILYALNHRAITSAVVGLRNYDQLTQAVGMFDVPDLTNDEKIKLDSSVGINYYVDHR